MRNRPRLVFTSGTFEDVHLVAILLTLIEARVDSMLVDNGRIETMFIEPDVAGDPFEVSDADTMWNYLRPN